MFKERPAVALSASVQLTKWYSVTGWTRGSQVFSNLLNSVILRGRRHRSSATSHVATPPDCSPIPAARTAAAASGGSAVLPARLRRPRDGPAPARRGGAEALGRARGRAGPGRAGRRLRSAAGAVAGRLRGRGAGTLRDAGDSDFQPAAGPTACQRRQETDGERSAVPGVRATGPAAEPRVSAGRSLPRGHGGRAGPGVWPGRGRAGRQGIAGLRGSRGSVPVPAPRWRWPGLYPGRGSRPGGAAPAAAATGAGGAAGSTGGLPRAAPAASLPPGLGVPPGSLGPGVVRKPHALGCALSLPTCSGLCTCLNKEGETSGPPPVHF